MRDLPGKSSRAALRMRLKTKKARKPRNKAYPLVQLRGKLIVSRLPFASVLSTLKGVSWLRREMKLGAGPVRQICTVSELRNQKCQWVGLGLEPHQARQPVYSSPSKPYFCLSIQSSWTPPEAAKTRLTVPVEPRKTPRLRESHQWQSIRKAVRKEGPGSRVSCRAYKEKTGTRGLGVHLQLGTRLRDRGGRVSSKSDDGRLLKADQKEASAGS